MIQYIFRLQHHQNLGPVTLSQPCFQIKKVNTLFLLNIHLAQIHDDEYDWDDNGSDNGSEDWDDYSNDDDEQDYELERGDDDDTF